MGTLAPQPTHTMGTLPPTTYPTLMKLTLLLILTILLTSTLDAHAQQGRCNR